MTFMESSAAVPSVEASARGRSALFVNAFGDAEYFPAGTDSYLEFNPTSFLSGPIVKNRVWLSGGWNPQIFTQERAITYLDAVTRVPTGQVEGYRFRQVKNYGFARVDAQPFSRLRLTSTYNYNPITQRVAFRHFIGTQHPSFTSGGTLSGAAYLIRQVDVRITERHASGVWSVTERLSKLSFRHYFLNENLEPMDKEIR